MSWSRIVQRGVWSLASWPVDGRRRRDVGTDGQGRHLFFVEVARRPTRLSVAEDTADALVAATEAGEHPACKSSGALQLRGVARVAGHLVALHELDRMRGPARPAAIRS